MASSDKLRTHPEVTSTLKELICQFLIVGQQGSAFTSLANLSKAEDLIGCMQNLVV